MVPFGVQNGTQNCLNIDLGSIRGSRGSQGSMLEGFLIIVRHMVGWLFLGFWDVYQCLDSLCWKWLLWRFGGGGWRYRFVASIPLDMIWVCSCMLFVMIFHMLIDAWIFHFETIAFMCGGMVRALVWSVVIGLVCWPVVWAALFDLVCLVWSRMVWTVCADWLVLVSSVWWFLSLPKSDLFDLVCIGLVEAALLQAGLFSLGSVLSCSLWSVLVLPPLLYSRLACSVFWGWCVLVQLGLV